MRTLYFCPVVSSFFSSPNLSRHTLDVYHTSTHGVALVQFRMQVWNVLHTAQWKSRMQKIAICRPSHKSVRLYLRNEGVYRQSEKKLVKQQYLLHKSSQYGELRPSDAWDRFGCLGTPANFCGFRILASLLKWRRSPEANQILHDVWLSPGLVHYVYIFGGSCPWRNFSPF